MPTDQTAGAPPAVASAPAPEGVEATAEPFDSITVLRKEHIRLLRREHRDGEQAGMVSEIAEFLRRAQATGKRIDATPEREMVQSVIDYWTATLLTLVGPTSLSAGPILLDEFDSSQAPDLRDCPSPFRGLRAFQEEHAEQFFGRDDEVQALLRKVATSPVVVVAGPSGSGKSSLVLAGLLPHLKRGTVPGTEGWRFLKPLVPGTDPIAALLGVVPHREDPSSWVERHRARVAGSSAAFRKLVDATLGRQPVVLVIDQLEELVTLCGDKAARDQFAEALAGFVHSKSLHRLILVMREDFARELREVRAIRALIEPQDAWFIPPPLSPRELRRVIECPAEIVGLKLEDGIVDDLVKEVLGDPTALPLLQFTLLKLWEKRYRNRITWEKYREVGTPSEALKRTAEEVYRRVSTVENKKAVETIFSALVQLAFGEEFVRRRVRRETLNRIIAADRVDRTLDTLVEAGLIRKTLGVERDDDRFEVVHEALIRNWPRLQRWVQGQWHRRERQRQLETAAQLWAKSGRDRGYLLSGSALVEAKEHADRSPELQEFIAASEAREVRTRLRLRLVAWACAVLLLVTLGALAREVQAERDARASLRQAKAALDDLTRASQGSAVAAQEAADAIATSYASQDSTRGVGNRNAGGVSGVIQRIITAPIAGKPNFWPNGAALRVRFLDGTPELQAKVRQYAVEWSRYANITFDFDSAVGNGDIRISFDQPVMWSLVGTQARDAAPKEPTMNLGLVVTMKTEAEIRRSVLLEFGHALGLVHELQNPNAVIPWDTAAVYQYFARVYGYNEEMVRDNVLRKYSSAIGYARPFDPHSIMNVFRIPAYLTHGQYEVRLENDLSESDKALIASIYRRTVPPQPSPGGDSANKS